MQHRRGFTLVELVMVMVILGIMVTFAAPRIDLSAYRANTAVQALGTTILAAQRQAVTQQHDIIVRFDSTAPNVTIHQDRNNNGVVDAGEHVRAVPLGEGMVFGRGPAPAMPFGTDPISVKRWVDGRAVLVFHRDGSASEAGGFYVTSSRAQNSGSRPNDARAVSFERATGRAQWFRYTSAGWRKVF